MLKRAKAVRLRTSLFCAFVYASSLEARFIFLLFSASPARRHLVFSLLTFTLFKVERGSVSLQNGVGWRCCSSSLILSVSPEAMALVGAGQPTPGNSPWAPGCIQGPSFSLLWFTQAPANGCASNCRTGIVKQKRRWGRRDQFWEGHP